MFKKNRLILLLCVLILIGILAGCDSDKVSPDVPMQNSEITADTKTTDYVEVPANKDWLIAAIAENYSWNDGVRNQNEVSIRLPHINSDMHFAVEFNDHINSFADKIIEETEECMNGAFSTHIISVDYEAWQNGDTLSLLITTRTATDYVEYQVWNFDLDDAETMSTAQMCDEYLDLEYPQFLKYTADMILQEFQTEFADFIKSFPGEYEFIQNLYLSDRLVTLHYRLFLNEEGTLMLVSDRPSIAGAMCYASIEEMFVDPELVSGEADAWNWLFDLYLGSDPDNEVYAAELLRIAYKEDADDFTDALNQRTSSEIEAIQTALRVKQTKEG